MNIHHPTRNRETRTRLRQYVQAGLTDGECAALFGVGGSTIHSWRQLLGIVSPRLVRFRRRFALQHGPDLLLQIERMLRDGYPYATIGRAAGLSRERIRQIRALLRAEEGA